MKRAKITMLLGGAWLLITVVWAIIDHTANNIPFPDTADGNFSRHIGWFIISGLLAIILVVIGLAMGYQAGSKGSKNGK